MRRRRSFSPSFSESLESRVLLSGGLREKQALAVIDRDIRKTLIRKGDVSSGSFLITMIADDLNYEGVFNARSRPGRRHTRVSLIPPTEAQTLAAFQSAYNQAIIQSTPAAAQMLALDAALAVSVYSGTQVLYEFGKLAGEAGSVYATSQLSKEMMTNMKEINELVEKIMENPLFETPEGQELALLGEEIALSQVVDGQPINFPTPPVIPLPPQPPYFPPPPPLPPRIAVNPQSLTFTTSAGSNPAEEGFTVSNIGGGTLHCTETTRTSWITLINEGTSPDGAAVVGVEVNAALLSEGTYSGTIIVSAPEDPYGTKIVAVTLHVTAPPAPVFRGMFNGWVENNDASDGGGDPGGSFFDQYSGPISMTLTGGPGAYTLTFQGTLTNPDSAEEDFTTNFNVYVTVSNITQIRFTTPMGDGQMLVTGSISGSTFAGTWVFQATNPNDQSDSGEGTFSLST